MSQKWTFRASVFKLWTWAQGAFAGSGGIGEPACVCITVAAARSIDMTTAAGSIDMTTAAARSLAMATAGVRSLDVSALAVRSMSMSVEVCEC